MTWPPTTHQDVQDAVTALRGAAINVKDPAYGALGDGTTDDATAIQAAITAATPAGGTVYFPAGIYICGSTITLPGGVHLQGSGIGGDIFSNTDVTLPFKGTVLKLKSGVNVDLIKTVNFATLTGQTSPTNATTPGRFGLHGLVLDGNQQGNTAGIPLRIFGRAYEVDHVIIQNGAAGGVYSEYGSGGYEMEARWSNFTITDNAGTGLDWHGPHDSQFANGLVARNSGHVGVQLGAGWIGGEMFANVHVWGNHTYQWVISTNNAAFLNCVSDGPGGVQVTGNGNTWIGGAIFGSAVVGENAITIGDGTTRTIGPNVFRTRVFNYSKGSIFQRTTANTTCNWNVYQVSANLGGATKYGAGAGKSTTTGALTFPVTSVAVTDASSFPTGGGSLYLSDGTTIVTASYTGVTGNTLTGVTGGSGSLTSGAAVFTLSTNMPDDIWEILDVDNSATFGLIQSAQSLQLSQNWLMPTSFAVGAQTLQPNSSATALRHRRNETGRVDLNWDNSGTAGAYSFQNGATVEGRSDTTTRTWQLNSALGTVQPGASATGSRPSAATAGAAAMFYDTTLHKPIWSDGSVWKDATGATV